MKAGDRRPASSKPSPGRSEPALKMRYDPTLPLLEGVAVHEAVGGEAGEVLLERARAEDGAALQLGLEPAHYDRSLRRPSGVLRLALTPR
jgi:hypothetical protein